jgi:hypothetical protein
MIQTNLTCLVRWASLLRLLYAVSSILRHFWTPTIPISIIFSFTLVVAPEHLFFSQIKYKLDVLT